MFSLVSGLNPEISPCGRNDKAFEDILKGGGWWRQSRHQPPPKKT